MFYTKTQYFWNSFSCEQEEEMYYSLKAFLDQAGVLSSSTQTVLLHRYCRTFFEYMKMLKKDPTHWQVEKMASLLGRMEEELCLTPKSLQEYHKNQLLMEAKRQKLESQK